MRSSTSKTMSQTDVRPMASSFPRALAVSLSLYAVFSVAIYYNALKWLIEFDWPRPDYSHCYLVPLASLYLIWEKKAELLATPSRPTWAGLVPVGFAIVSYWLGELAGEFFAMYLSLWLLIVGLCWIHLGWKKLRIIGFQLMLLIAMFPLPHFVNNKITLQLKLISSQVGVFLLQLWGMTAYREGNVIDIGFTQLQVVDACSGLRYLFPLMVLGLILAYWLKDALWKRAALFLTTVPVAVLVNAVRIAATGILYPIWGAEVAEGFFHDFSGWLIFMLTLMALWLEMLVLKRLPPRAARASAASSLQSPEESSEGVDASPERAKTYKWMLHPASCAAIVLLGATLAFSQGIDFHEKTPVAKPLSRFPLQVGEWSGAPRQMELEIIKELDLSDYLLIDYSNAGAKTVNFYTAYYESQRKGESIHSPSTCLPGSGWNFNESGYVDVPLSGSESIRVNRAFMQKDREKNLVYYWFPARGRILTDVYQMKLYTFWDALTRQRTDGALVRMLTPVYDGEEPQQADARLQSFAQKAIPALSEYLPGK